MAAFNNARLACEISFEKRFPSGNSLKICNVGNLRTVGGQRKSPAGRGFSIGCAASG